MPLADQETGSPPAVSPEMLQEWSKLADDIASGFNMGGEMGMDLLAGLMPDWCEAVEDVNAAREICVNLAAEGRRHEAIHWHADGFFEIADRLSPERPGWEAWEEAFAERGIVVPRVNDELREMADRIHEDLVALDISGRSLGAHLDALRRNVLARGHIGERLTVLQNIRSMDPAATAWEVMTQPILARRVKEIASELDDAIARESFLDIDRLKREADAGAWPGGGDPEVWAKLESAKHWREATGLCRALAESAAALSSRAGTLAQVFENCASNAASFPSALYSAIEARKTYEAYHQQVSEAVAIASRVPAIASKLAAADIKNRVQQSDGVVRAANKIVGEAEAHWKWVQAFRELESQIEETIYQAPLNQGRDWEEIKKRCRSWLDQAARAKAKVAKLGAKSPVARPPSTTAAIGRLDDVAEQVTRRVRGVTKTESWVVGGVLGMIGLAALAMMLILAFAR
jgi:broad specificity phosphatase PhoE